MCYFCSADVFWGVGVNYYYFFQEIFSFLHPVVNNVLRQLSNSKHTIIGAERSHLQVSIYLSSKQIKCYSTAALSVKAGLRSTCDST